MRHLGDYMAFENENPYVVDQTVVQQLVPPQEEGVDEPPGHLSAGQHFGIIVACCLVALFVFLATLFVVATVWHGVVIPNLGSTIRGDHSLEHGVEISISLFTSVVACIEMRRRLVRTIKREG